jgi:hypothetical protein
MKTHKLFWYKSQSGRSFPGAIPVAAFAIFCIYVSYMLVGRSAPSKESTAPSSVVAISDIASTSADIRTVKEEDLPVQSESISTRREREAISSNLGLRPMDVEAEVVSRNSIHTVMQQLMAESEPQDRRVINDSPLIPTYVEERELLPTKGTVVESENATDVEIVGFTRKEEDPESKQKAKKTGFETDLFLPRGYRIPVILLGYYETGDIDDIVEFAVLRDVKFQNKVLLRKGLRILGTGSQTSVRETITFNADMILYPDGRELPISGLLKSPDGRSGFQGDYVMPPVGVNAASYAGPIIEALATIGTATEERDEVITSDNTTVTQTNTVAKAYDAQNAIIEAASQIAQDRVDDYLKDYVQRNTPYVRIDAGVTGYFVLDTAIDLTSASVGGSYRQEQKAAEKEEAIAREAVENYYSYGTVANAPDVSPTPTSRGSRETNQPLNIPGIR